MGQKAGIDRNAIEETAALVADAEGYAALSLSAIAGRLGIKSPSLYNHVDGIAEIRRMLSHRGARELSVRLADAAHGLTGADAIRSCADTYRRFAHERPGLYDASQRASHPDDDPEFDEHATAAVGVVMAALLELGVPPNESIPTVRTLRAVLHGFVLLEREHGFGLPDDVDRSFAHAIDVFLAGVTGHRDA